jgi:hypothetical protein
MVTFENKDTYIKVKLDDKHAGDIKEVTDGYAYFPKGSKRHGDVFATAAEVIADVVGDD